MCTGTGSWFWIERRQVVCLPLVKCGSEGVNKGCHLTVIFTVNVKMRRLGSGRLGACLSCWINVEVTLSSRWNHVEVSRVWMGLSRSRIYGTRGLFCKATTEPESYRDANLVLNGDTGGAFQTTTSCATGGDKVGITTTLGFSHTLEIIFKERLYQHPFSNTLLTYDAF